MAVLLYLLLVLMFLSLLVISNLLGIVSALVLVHLPLLDWVASLRGL